MPFPATKVIPDGWSRHHAPVARGGMNARVEIRDPATATTGWNAATESVTTVPGPVTYSGPARVQALLSDQTTVQADEHVQHRPYLVQLDFDAALVGESWEITVTSAPNDAQLLDVVLVVDDVQHGSERFTRDLRCHERIRS